MLNDELHFLLMKCFYHNNRMIIQKIQGTGLYPGQPKILECLTEKDGISPKEIGTICALDKSTITGLLNKMERQQLIVRRSLSTDKRSVKIYLTDYGRQMGEQVKEIFRSVDDFASKDLSAEEKTILIGILKKIISTFEREEK
ncbi:MAG: MarR family winged helix-turn-helix transcriptional regulator [Ruminococcus sp.]|jgi:DNA-binding MarR family transcriptional regulator